MALTVSQLVQHIRERIDKLNDITDIIHEQYNIACDIIDPNVDRRQVHLEQLKDLEITLADIIDKHPVMSVDKRHVDVTNAILNLIANSENQKNIQYI